MLYTKVATTGLIWLTSMSIYNEPMLLMLITRGETGGGGEQGGAELSNVYVYMYTATELLKLAQAQSNSFLSRNSIAVSFDWLT